MVPTTRLLFYQHTPEAVPVLKWLKELRKKDKRAHAKCVTSLERLRVLGFELRRPRADFLRDGIYELRVRSGHSNYRLLYFFHGQNVAVLAHALHKTDSIPPEDVSRAIARKKAFVANPEQHTY